MADAAVEMQKNQLHFYDNMKGLRPPDSAIDS